jgi:hypothetical protein
MHKDCSHITQKTHLNIMWLCLLICNSSILNRSLKTLSMQQSATISKSPLPPIHLAMTASVVKLCHMSLKVKLFMCSRTTAWRYMCEWSQCCTRFNLGNSEWSLLHSSLFTLWEGAPKHPLGHMRGSLDVVVKRRIPATVINWIIVIQPIFSKLLHKVHGLN